uniref:F-box domain-containing protein n=1 Tax=Setaria viridis TaxID=4556 RepID=A0A4V6DBU1_SETVI|nr:hypothetical protein SEVIR_2G357900v2 [Setaria viridis]
MASRGFLSTTLCSGLTRFGALNSGVVVHGTLISTCFFSFYVGGEFSLRHVVWVTFVSQIPFCLIFILTSLWSNDATIDRISDLPDELLHIVLLRLRSNGDAPRTSVLSYCWRRVWAKLPKIVLDYHDPPPQDVIPKLLNSVDDALAAYSSVAPAVIKRLEVALPGRSGTHIPTYRVSNWLRFTSQRKDDDVREGLLLPACDKATRIELFLKHQWHLWFPLAASFSMLTDLAIHDTSVELDELESLVCSKQCPHLRNLQIVNVQSLSVDVFSVRSNSLVSLRFDAWIQNATFPFRLKGWIGHSKTGGRLHPPCTASLLRLLAPAHPVHAPRCLPFAEPPTPTPPPILLHPIFSLSPSYPSPGGGDGSHGRGPDGGSHALVAAAAQDLDGEQVGAGPGGGWAWGGGLGGARVV